MRTNKWTVIMKDVKKKTGRIEVRFINWGTISYYICKILSE